MVTKESGSECEVVPSIGEFIPVTTGLDPRVRNFLTAVDALDRKSVV